MNEYSVTNLLEKLAENEVQKRIIRLISEEHTPEELLELLLMSEAGNDAKV